MAFIEHGLFARGAIASGAFFADEDFIHGPALERAVDLEKHRAVHPRVVLDEASIALATERLASGDAAEQGWRDQLLVDEEGVVFVNYLQTVIDDPVDSFDPHAMLVRHRTLVEANLHAFDGVERVEQKYRWLAAYHNHFVRSQDAELGDDRLLVRCSRPIGEFMPLASSR